MEPGATTGGWQGLLARELPAFTHPPCQVPLCPHSNPRGLPAGSNLKEMASAQDSLETGREESLGSGWAGTPNMNSQCY